MKKITFFVLMTFTVATLFAAARPSLDGRAVVADNGTMPRGLFARTVGYLPGDSVTVTNPATGSTIDVLVLGAIDPSEGVAILLSPEAADGLRIRPESNVQVKLTKRAGSLDENANGSAILSEGDDEEIPAPSKIAKADTSSDSVRNYNTKKEVHKAVVIPDEEEKPSETSVSAPVVAAPTETENEIEPDYEEYPTFADTSSENTEKSDDLTDVPEYEDYAVSPDSDYDEYPATPDTTEYAANPDYEEYPSQPEYEETPAIAETPVEEPVETVEEPVKKVTAKPKQNVVGTVYEEVPPLPGETEDVERVVLINGKVPTYEEVSEEKVNPENFDEAYSEERVVPENYSQDELVMGDSEIPADESVPGSDAEKLQPVIVVETGAEDDEYNQPVIEELPILADSENESESVYEELPEGIESEPQVVMNEEPYEEEGDTYQPIVLVPVDMNPPSEEVDETEKIADVENAEVVEASQDETESSEIAAIPEKPVVTNDWSNYVVPSVKNLRSGCYYVQVASLGNAENIKNFVDRYSDKYPVVLVQNSSKSAYQVMVGPLNIDEYGAVDEKFKANGFKDSFVRKIR